MPMSTDVSLPRDYAVRFAPCCLICNVSEPDALLKLSSAISGWWSALCWFPRPRYQVLVPVCRECRRTYVRQQRLTTAVVWLTAGLITWFLLPEIRVLVPGPLHK
ncbi:MAG: hypothetical protein ACK58L_14190, partial [Planctomycetota bacterium]